MDVRIKFLGADRTVTGSKHLVEIDDYRVMIDCGMFQGMKVLRLRNWEDFPVDPSTIDAILLTHAHIDHSGYLPRLVKEGFSGPIYCTPATAGLVELLLRDSAKLQVEEAEYTRRKGYSHHQNPEALYNEKDVENVLPMIQTVEFGQPLILKNGAYVEFIRAGHILGASMIRMSLKGENQKKTILFSGDLGKYDDPLHPPPTEIESADILLVESTYANKAPVHTNIIEQLASKLNHALNRGGCVVIPAFAVGRTQMILYYLRQLFAKGLIPSNVAVYVDSPMAIAATKLYKRDLDKTFAGHQLEDEIFHFPQLHYISDQSVSIGLNEIKSNAIIISASGMGTGGRILHHLANRLPRQDDTVLFIGFQVEGTRGRALLDGQPEIRIFGEMFPVYCDIKQVEGFSAHADQDELHRWLDAFKGSPKMTFVVHGEIDAAVALKDHIKKTKGWNVFVPEYLESFKLFSGI
ncbi:MAG TPA: MBL fold metallo-hydrolase [Catalimonadaceae bacterium]|nr:MBL fold metallo-hydrolase [Catalimonadaceae bacterium]